MIRLLILAALLLPLARTRASPRPDLRGSFRHDHRRRHRPGRPAGVDGPARVRGAKPVGGQPVGVGDGDSGRRAAVDPDPGRSAVPLHEPGVRPGVFDHRRDHGAGVRGASVVGRRALLLAGAAFPAAAFAQCVTDRFAVGMRASAACGSTGPSLPPGVTLDLVLHDASGTLDPRITFTRASSATYAPTRAVSSRWRRPTHRAGITIR